MAKFSGFIGYAVDSGVDETGISKPTIVEKFYSGDFARKSSRFMISDKINPNVEMSNEISVIMDSYLEMHYMDIRYVIIDGCRWRVNSVEPRRPRMILNIGGLYNEG